MASDLVKSLWSKHPSRPLYHYTSPAGLIGIVESKSLWASGVQYLNDTAEYRHAASITQGLLTKYLQNENGPWNGYYGMLLQGLPFCTDTTVFVGSLSEAKDKLSQWRAYCSDGGGFSIGFDHKLIENQAKKHGFKLLKCEYNSANQESICAELISDGCRAAEEAESRFSKQEEPNREGLTAAGLHCGFVMPFMEIAPALKASQFRGGTRVETSARSVRRPGPETSF